MKQRCIFLLFLIVAILFLIGCSEKCEDFNNEIVDWMPYKVGDKIVIYQNSDLDTLIVNYSEIYHTSKLAYLSKCICENSFILGLSSNSLNIDIRFNDSRFIEQSEIEINDEWMAYSEHLDNIELNGQVYNDLIVYKNTNQASAIRFERIIISESIGIIAIIGDNDEWLIIDNSAKQIEISDIEFKSSDC